MTTYNAAEHYKRTHGESGPDKVHLHIRIPAGAVVPTQPERVTIEPKG